MRSFTFCIVHHEERQGSDRAIWSFESVWRTDAPRSYHSPFSSTSLLGYFTKQQQGWDSKWYSAGYHLRWRYQQNLCRGLGCTSLHLKYQGKQGSFQPEECFELSSELGKDVALVAEVCLSEARQTRSVMDSAAPTLWVMWWNTWSVIGLAGISPTPLHKRDKVISRHRTWLQPLQRQFTLEDFEHVPKVPWAPERVWALHRHVWKLNYCGLTMVWIRLPKRLVLEAWWTEAMLGGTRAVEGG